MLNSEREKKLGVLFTSLNTFAFEALVFNFKNSFPAEPRRNRVRYWNKELTLILFLPLLTDAQFFGVE